MTTMEVLTLISVIFSALDYVALIFVIVSNRPKAVPQVPKVVTVTKTTTQYVPPSTPKKKKKQKGNKKPRPSLHNSKRG